jgi:ribosome biogenesis GTPase
MHTLNDWGWNEQRAAEFAAYAKDKWKPGRIIRPGRGLYRIAVGGSALENERDARLPGKALNRSEVPAAGDWVAWKDEGGTALIGGILSRKTVISRKVPGDISRQQIIGVNVDVLFVVQALGSGRGFTVRGLERYITMAWESGCGPVVLLNKSDLAEDIDSDVAAAETAAPGVQIICCSTITGEGMAAVKETMPPGLTGAFVGPSGAGKSSIINAIAGNPLADTGGVRENDSRGRHTTTHRELRLLADGRLLLDTPGLRELQLWGEAESADSAFPEIEDLARECRFRDCRHENEPGCAVRAGLEEGLILSERYESWLSLRKELVWLEARRDERAKKVLDRKWLDIARANRLQSKGKAVW